MKRFEYQVQQLIDEAKHVSLMCQTFHWVKKFAEKISPVMCIGEIGENIRLAKISAYTVFGFDW